MKEQINVLLNAEIKYTGKKNKNVWINVMQLKD